MTLSVIIPTFQRPAELLRNLSRLQQQTCGQYEIIVVDNAADTSLEVRIRQFNRTALAPAMYLAEPRLGLHYARHAGARLASGDVLVFTDDDATASPGWLAAYGEAFRMYPDMAAAGGPVLPIWEQPPPNWLLVFMLDKKQFPLLSLMNFGHEFRLDRDQIFVGTNMAVRRHILFEVGGFNPEAFGDVWLGDGESGLRAKLADVNQLVGYVPDAVINHHIEADRMSVDYIWRRMANEGGCELYTRFHTAPADRLSIANYAFSLAVKNVLFWALALLRRGQVDPLSLRIQGRAARTLRQVALALRLLHDAQYLRLIRKQDWLNGDPSSLP